MLLSENQSIAEGQSCKDWEGMTEIYLIEFSTSIIAWTPIFSISKSAFILSSISLNYSQDQRGIAQPAENIIALHSDFALKGRETSLEK